MKRIKDAPKPLPTCTCPPPPIFTGYWDESSWNGWFAFNCPCYGHSMWRAIRSAGKIK